MRYLPLTEADRRYMLATIGVPSVDSLFRDVPKSARLTDTVDLPDHHDTPAKEPLAVAAISTAMLTVRHEAPPPPSQESDPT